MSVPNLEKKPAAWKETTLDERFHNCRAMLVMWGLLSHGESENVKRRLDKMRRAYVAQRDAKPPTEPTP